MGIHGSFIGGVPLICCQEKGFWPRRYRCPVLKMRSMGRESGRAGVWEARTAFQPERWRALIFFLSPQLLKVGANFSFLSRLRIFQSTMAPLYSGSLVKSRPPGYLLKWCRRRLNFPEWNTYGHSQRSVCVCVCVCVCVSCRDPY